jgi:hypothetical protein
MQKVQRTFDSFSEKADVNKAKILELLSKVKRDGMDELIEHLCASDYFTAPAASKANFHGCYPGGLAEHSLNVTLMLLEENSKWGVKHSISEESCIVIGLLHDVCKVGLYKNLGEGKYVKDSSVKGHARLSIERVKHYIELTPVEESTILYHMGLFGALGKYDIEYKAIDVHYAIMKYAIVQVFAAIDMAESRRRQGV